MGSIWAMAIMLMVVLSSETSWYIGWPIIISFLIGMFFTVRSKFGKIFYIFFSGILIAFLLLANSATDSSPSETDIIMQSDNK